MDNRIQKAGEGFIMNLTGANFNEIQEYVAEIRQNREFHSSIDETMSGFKRRHYLSWYFGIGSELGAVLYAICRRQKPDIIVETGVAGGMSSSYILCALDQNRHGQLFSIDLPAWQENQSGWMIPDYLKHRWHLILGRSSLKLATLLKKDTEIDIFLHDSDHSYKNMMWEFQIAWKYLINGGLLLSHNIDNNGVFSDFCQNHGVKGYSLANLGGIMKI